MAIKKLKPNTPGQRFRSVSAFDDITKSTPEKSLLAPLKHKAGRNNIAGLTAIHCNVDTRHPVCCQKWWVLPWQQKCS